MGQKIYHIDAFADEVFTGNPAAVCPLDHWLEDDLLQKIAAENNLAETAFYVKQGARFTIRWFTPTVEVDLCGHATLAAAYVLFNHEYHSGNTVLFHSPRSGELTVTRDQDSLALNFPADEFDEIPLTDGIRRCFDRVPSSVFKGRSDYLFVYEREDHIRTMDPVLEEIAKLEGRGVIITAKGHDVDFVSRFFAPRAGIPEDPVTGSAHTTLVPYWARRLNRSSLSAVQLSKRRGRLQCRYLNDRVEISGRAKLYLVGQISAIEPERATLQRG